MRVTTILAAAGAVVVLAGCGGGGQSASGACHGYNSWRHSQNQADGTLPYTGVKATSALQQAVSQAPSGPLYRDLHALLQDVQQHNVDGYLSDVLAVDQDCAKVNPNS
jgi:hypothetical protein